MSFRNQYARVGQIPFIDLGVATLDVQKGFLLRGLSFRVNGSVTVAGAGTATAVPESPFTLIRLLEIVLDGRDTIVRLTGAQLQALSRFYNSAVPQFQAPAGTAGTNPFSCFFNVPFELPYSVKPIDTLLDTRLYEQIQVRVQWGTLTAAVADGVTDVLDGAVAQTQSPGNAPVTSLEVLAYQTAEPSDQLFSMYRRHFIQRDVIAATPDFDIDIPVSNMIRSLLIRTTTGLPATVNPVTPVNTILNEASLVSDVAFFPVNRFNGAMIQSLNGLDFKMVDPAGAFSSAPTGYYLLDFMEDGYLTSVIQSGDIASLKLRLGVNLVANTPRVEVIVSEIVPAEVANLVAASIGG